MYIEFKNHPAQTINNDCMAIDAAFNIDCSFSRVRKNGY